MPKWTEQQEQAIEKKGTNLLVSAAAGSGKTTVMIERIVRLLEAGETSLDRLLVVTFTIAAASSMKVKLAERLEKAIKENPENDRLHAETAKLDRADISTIHAYSSRLLKRYYFLTDLPPDFHVPDDAFTNMIRQNAVDETLERAAKLYEDGLFPEYAEVLTQFAGGRDDKRLADAVLSLARFRAAHENPEAFKQRTLALYADPTGQAWETYYYKTARGLLEPLPKYLDQLAAAFAGTPAENAVNRNLVYYYEAVSDALSCKTVSAMREVMSRKEKPGFQKKGLPESWCDDYDHSRKKIKALFSVIKSLPEPAGMTDILPAAEGLFRVTEMFEEICRAKFLEQNCVTFDQMLRSTLDLLDENPAILQEVREGLDFLFVDEYQDVNPLLNKLVELLSNGHNLFFVGDVKQSIYGFNAAHPELFVAKMRAYDGVLGTRVDLSNNFRSSAALLDAVNFLFKTHMHEWGDNEVEYAEEAYLRPSPDKSSPQYKPAMISGGVADEAACEFLLIPKDEDTDEAEAVACRIDELMNCMVLDQKNNEYRPLAYGDIVLLGRKNSYAERYTDAFRRHGIPYRVTQDKNNEDSDNGTGALLAFLRLLLLRRDDLSLITALSSPIGRFTLSELALIRQKTPDGSFYDAFTAFDGDAEIVKKREEFTNLLDRMTLLQGSLALPDFLETLCRETGYLFALACEKDSVKLLNAVERLIAAARRYSEQETGGLRGFLAYAESAAKQSEHRGESDKADNAVHFMTIHKSKGLEFPVVIVVGTEQSIHKSGKPDTFLCDNELGVGFPTCRRDAFGACEKTVSPAHQAISLKKKYFDKAEGLRLFYVALTRAINKCILVSCLTENETRDRCFLPGAALTRTYSSFDELVLPLLYCHRDGAALRDYAGGEISDLLTESRWSVRIWGEDGFTLAPPAQKSAPSEPFDAEKYLSFVQERLAWRYPYAAAVTARSKQAPSRSAVRQRPDLHRPQFADPVYTGAQKGTAVHFFMEHLDFANADGARAQAERMRFNGTLQEEEFAALPFEAIDAFLSSPLGQRLRRAETVNRERAFCLIVPFPETGDEALVQGNIDCYFFEGDRIVLLDYKTDVISGNLDARVAHHTPQMRLYKRALENLYPGKTVEVYLHFFSVSRSVRVE